MKKKYTAPHISVAEMDTESLLNTTSYLDVGGYGKPRVMGEDALERLLTPRIKSEYAIKGPLSSGYCNEECDDEDNWE